MAVANYEAPHLSSQFADLMKYAQEKGMFSDSKDYVPLLNTQAADMDNIAVGFGGFAPTALDNGQANIEQAAYMERVSASRREAMEKAREIEQARIANRSSYREPNGTIWSYVTLTNGSIRIEGCQSTQSSIRVPASIDGKPVAAINDAGMCDIESATEIICHDDIYTIGKFAFRGCINLKRLVLPKQCGTFDMTWMKGCGIVEELVLPGQLTKLPSLVFNDCPLKKLTIGAALQEVEPGAFGNSVLEQLVIVPENAFIMTDGTAIYSKDGLTLLAMAVPCERYAVKAGCIGIAKKGMSTFESLVDVRVPDSMLFIGDFAFSRTSVTNFVSSPNLQRIGESAFFNCKELKRIDLKSGLLQIDDRAFAKTSLEELVIPASVQRIGRDVAIDTDLTYQGNAGTFRIDPNSPYLEMDNYGALYALEDGQKHLCRLVNPYVTEVRLLPGTAAVNNGACLKHAKLQRITLPEGLEIIGKGAFKDCHKLTDVFIPDTVRIIDDEAFLDSALTSVYLPASLEYLGENSLITYGAHRGERGTSIKDVEVSHALTRYYTIPGMLIEIKNNGRERVLLHIKNTDVIRFPEKVNAIAPYAFNNSVGIREMYVSERIMYIDMRGLAVRGGIEKVRVEMTEPYEGHDYFDFHFPDTSYGAQQLALSFSLKDHITAKNIFEHYDISISTRGGYGRGAVGGMPVYEQAIRMVDRLKDPVYLTLNNRAKFNSTLTQNIENICAELAKHDDRYTIDDLVDLGYLTEENLVNVIGRVSGVQDASITNYLLEIKRLRFGSGFDESEFDL